MIVREINDTAAFRARSGCSGEMGAPCGIPLFLCRAAAVRRLPPLLSSSSTGTTIPCLISCYVCRSLTRRATAPYAVDDRIEEHD